MTAVEIIWPGFGDNMRVLMWMLDRCEGKADAVVTPIGFEPKAEDINLEGIDISLETLKGLLEVDTAIWKEDVAGIKEFYKQFGSSLPKELAKQLEDFENRLK